MTDTTPHQPGRIVLHHTDLTIYAQSDEICANCLQPWPCPDAPQEAT